MATVEEVARSVLAAVDSDADHLLSARWVAERYRQLCSRARFRHLRQIGEITLPAPYTTGTVAASTGSIVVTGTGTAWTPLLVGRHFRYSAVWYRIGGVQSATILTLSRPVTETTVTASGYTIVQRYVEIPPDVRWTGAFVHMRRRRELDYASALEIDRIDPERQRIDAGGPYAYNEAGTWEGKRVYEFYPPSSQAEVIHYVFWSVPLELKPSDSIPSTIDAYVLKEGALIDVYRHMMAAAMRAGSIEGAALYRNEMRAQMTSWERNIHEAIRSDRGDDDITLILKSPTSPIYRGDIVTAQDEIYSRGNRP